MKSDTVLVGSVWVKKYTKINIEKRKIGKIQENSSNLTKILRSESGAIMDSKAVQRSALCRSRRELSDEYLLAKIGVDTAENEPLEVWGKIFNIIQSCP